MKNTMIGILAFAISAVLWAVPVSANECSYETQEARITEELAKEPDRQYHILTAEELANFKRHLHEMNGIEIPIDKVWIIQSVRPEIVHVFMMQHGCIWFYQATPAKAVARLISNA